VNATTSAPLTGLYVDWGVVHISVTNLAVIAAMVVVFLLAVLVPFHGPGSGDHPNRHRDAS
jgi:hypothetical protein